MDCNSGRRRRVVVGAVVRAAGAGTHGRDADGEVVSFIFGVMQYVFVWFVVGAGLAWLAFLFDLVGPDAKKRKE